MSLACLISPSEVTGYGNFGRNLTKGLRQIGADLVEGDDREPPPKTDAVVWATVPAYVKGCWKGQYKVAYTMWESTRVPESFRALFHEFDLICVPCKQNVESFSPWHDNVKQVPLGYDADTWVPLERELPDEFFTFLVGATGARKGYDLIVPAFKQAFPDWQEMRPQPRVIAKALRYPIEAPFVRNVVGAKGIEELLSLYQQAHCMVLPSRGEGWGYHPQQAVATGIPAICSEIPAHNEYIHIPGFLTILVTSAKAAYFIHGDPGNWWEPSLEALTEGMRDVYENYESWLEQAVQGAEIMPKEFSHRAMAEKLLEVIPEDAGPATDTWIPFQEQKFRVEVIQNLECDIGETHFELKAGETYWESADVKRVLQEAGYLAERAREDERGRV